MTIRAYLVRRLVLLCIVLFGISILTFLMVRVVPSDPAAVYVGPMARADQIEQARENLGLDKPLHVQYWGYLQNLVTGDWGESLRTHRPVLGDILHFLPASLQLILAAMALATAVGILLGAITAHRKGSWIDHLSRLFSTAGVSFPSFWLALILQVVFFRVLGLLPVAGISDIAVAQAHPIESITGMAVVDSLITGNFTAFWDTLRHLLLPVLALAAYPAGVITRMSRSAMIEALGQDHVRMAKAMGVSQRTIVFRYALKNALGPVLTVIGLMFAWALTGTFFIELIFSWPGLGTYATTSILSLDYPAIMGVTLLVATLYVLVNLVVDLVLAWLDPRIVLS